MVKLTQFETLTYANTGFYSEGAGIDLIFFIQSIFETALNMSRVDFL